MQDRQSCIPAINIQLILKSNGTYFLEIGTPLKYGRMYNLLFKRDIGMEHNAPRRYWNCTFLNLNSSTNNTLNVQSDG